MTKKQIEMLRGLIQAEIDYAIQDYVNKNPWSYEIKKDNDEFWEQFAETFNSTSKVKTRRRTLEELAQGHSKCPCDAL